MVNNTGSSTINVVGNVEIQKGTFSLFSGAAGGIAALNIAGSLSINSTGTLNSPVAASPSTISFTGSNSVFSNSGTFGNAANINFNVNSGSSLTINSDLGFGGTGRTFVVDGSVTTNNGTTFANNGTLTINAGKSFTANGTLTNNSSILLLSNSSGTGTLITNGTIGGTGSYSISQYLTAGRNWYISNPMNTAVSPSVASGTITLNGYDETTVTNGAGTWAVTTNPLAVGKGYVASVSTDGIITFTGTPNTGNTNIPLTSRTGTADKAGFNLIGNPYPSYLDWSLVVANTDNAAKLRSNTLWYRTRKLNQESQLVYQFQTVNGDGISVPNDGNAIIPPMQSFWVRAVAGVSSPIVVTNAMRANPPASDKLLKAPAAKNNDRTLVRLQVSNGVNTDETVLYVSENALNDSDSYDAPKMSNGNINIPEIFTTLNSERLVINALNNIPTDTPIGLGFVSGSATSFSIKANEIANLPSDVKVILKDNVTLAETDLTDGVTSYEFSPETTSSDRFSVIFRSAGSTTNLYNSDKHSTQIYVNEAGQIVIVSNEVVKYSIYNAVGQLIEYRKTTNDEHVVDRKLQTGVYLVKVNNTTTKVVVN
jgi:trimeric autotransporter adhesin